MNGRPEVNLCLQKCVWKHTNQGKNYPNQEIKAVEETRNINVDFLFFFLQRLIERFKSVQNFIFNIWGSREGELAKSHILHSNELIQVLKWQNYGEELQNNVRSPSYDNYDSLVILVSPSPLQCCLPASPPPQPPPFSSNRASLIFLRPDTLAEHLELYIYSISTFDFSAKRSLKTHALMTKDFYLWHED